MAESRTSAKLIKAASLSGELGPYDSFKHHTVVTVSMAKLIIFSRFMDDMLFNIIKMQPSQSSYNVSSR